ncbi:MAG: GNAT family N-acetyltransferase, partial [Bacteroidota bacterium]
MYQHLLASTPFFEVKIAEYLDEVESALKLRFNVFNLELKEGLESSYETGFDSDVYDTFCDHLIVKNRHTDKVVGTYRLLRQEKAEKSFGFYSENEFDLTRIKRLPGQSLELGRSCVAKEY